MRDEGQDYAQSREAVLLDTPVVATINNRDRQKEIEKVNTAEYYKSCRTVVLLLTPHLLLKTD